MTESVEALLRDIRKKNTAKRRAKMLSAGRETRHNPRNKSKGKETKNPKLNPLAGLNMGVFRTLKNTNLEEHAKKDADYEEIALNVEGKK